MWNVRCFPLCLLSNKTSAARYLHLSLLCPSKTTELRLTLYLPLRCAIYDTVQNPWAPMQILWSHLYQQWISFCQQNCLNKCKKTSHKNNFKKKLVWFQSGIYKFHKQHISVKWKEPNRVIHGATSNAGCPWGKSLSEHFPKNMPNLLYVL